MECSMKRSLLAASICTALASTAGHAATFNVTTNADSGAGSLRQALADANANGEADTIELSAISGQTITLSSGQLENYDDDVTINGAGVTVDADGASRALYSKYSSLEINDLTITGGEAVDAPNRGGSPIGGGLLFFSYGEGLTLNRTTITGNSAFAGGGVFFYAYGEVTISDSVISGNTAKYDGGGMYGLAYGDITVSDSTISGNTVDGPANPMAGPWLPEAILDRDVRQLSESRLAQRGDGGGFGGGGALRSDSSIRIERSTISGNEIVDGDVGGILLDASSVELIDSTVSGNSATNLAGGVGILAYDSARITNSTIEGNSAGAPAGGVYLYAPNSSTIEFSTVTGNSSGVGAGGFYFYGYYLDRGYGGELQHDSTIVSGNTAPVDPDFTINPNSTVNAAFSLVGVAPTTGTLNADPATVGLLGVDPGLGALLDNGGPTQTRVPAAGSPVVDLVPPGDAGCGTVPTDQRGSPRPFGSNCDIGAVERGPQDGAGAPVSVPTLDRIGLLLMAGLLGIAGFFGFRRQPRHRE